MTSHLPTVGFDAWLFDLDGVLTDIAEVYAVAWKLAFDSVLAEELERRRISSVAALDPVDA